MDYHQPDFYRFNEDSLKLVEKVVSCASSSVPYALDVGAGCGVIGIELSLKMKIAELHLLELQKDFRPLIEKNISLFIPQQKSKVIISPFSTYSSPHKYDLIVCNPPYYLPEAGQASKNEKRGICRSFQIDSWKDLLNLFENFLTVSGRAWVVVKNEKSLLNFITKELKGRKLIGNVSEISDIVILEFYLDV